MDLFKICFWLGEFLLNIFLSQRALEHPWLLHSVPVSLLLSLLYISLLPAPKLWMYTMKAFSLSSPDLNTSDRSVSTEQRVQKHSEILGCAHFYFV